MKVVSISLFAAGAVAAAYGVVINLKYGNEIAGLGTMSHNSWYQLSMVLFVAAGAFELIFGQRSA